MNKKQIAKIVYIVLFMLVLVVPGIGTFIWKQEAMGNEEAVDFKDMNYSNAADKIDDYFSVKFGFRNKMVEMYNGLHYNLFNESKEDSVIVGKDGWMFYGEALHDYTGENVLAEYEIEKIAKILAIAQKSVEGYGAEFVFVSAPNKMEIYGEYMPYYLVENKAEGNYEKLFAALEKYNVNNVDLKEILQAKAKEDGYRLYHKLDSHWNSLGAAVAYESIMANTGMDYLKFTNQKMTIEPSNITDLHNMLFANKKALDEDVAFENEMEFYPVSNFRSPEDLVIETENENRTGSVLMFRDSFGNSLYKFFAENFGYGQFMREIPYNLTRAEEKDLVVVEIVERNIKNLLSYLPITEAPQVNVSSVREVDVIPQAEITKKSGFNLITINCPEISKDIIDIYVEIDGVTYEAYPSAKAGVACLYLKEVNENCKLSVFFVKNGEVLSTKDAEIIWK